MTSQSRETREAVEAAVDLASAVKELRLQNQGLTTTSDRNRQLIVILAGLLVAVLALCVVVGWVAVQARDASSASAKATNRDVATCESINQARRDNRELWGFVFAETIPALSDPAMANPAAATRRAEVEAKFRAYLDRATVQRDCTPHR